MTFEDVVTKHGKQAVRIFLLWRYCQFLTGRLPGQHGESNTPDMLILSYKVVSGDLASDLEVELGDEFTPEQVDAMIQLETRDL